MDFIILVFVIILLHTSSNNVFGGQVRKTLRNIREHARLICSLQGWEYGWKLSMDQGWIGTWIRKKYDRLLKVLHECSKRRYL